MSHAMQVPANGEANTISRRQPGKIERIVTRFLGWWLWLANSRMGACSWSTRAYELKDRILRALATRDGEDYQHIVKECFACEGTGEVDFDDRCHRCSGTGIWSQRWVVLERWRLGNHVFHRPAGDLYRRPGQEANVINGLIRHRNVSTYAGDEALLWLALFFDRELWRHLMTSSRTYRQLWHPMLALQALTFELRDKSTWLVKRCWCYRCSARYWRFASKNNYCPTCHAWLAADDDELPF